MTSTLKPAVDGARMTLLHIDVLRAVDRSVSPDSIYIADEIYRDHYYHVKKGGKGHPPTQSLILRRLKHLAVAGMLERSQFTNGYYGYRWTITPAGREALSTLIAPEKEAE